MLSAVPQDQYEVRGGLIPLLEIQIQCMFGGGNQVGGVQQAKCGSLEAAGQHGLEWTNTNRKT